MSELGQTTDPVALVPGSVAGVMELATDLRSKAEVAASTTDRLHALRTPEGWEGDAAVAFGSRRDASADAFGHIAQMLRSCADALEQYSSTLGWGQQKAGDAIAMWQAAQGLTAQSQREQRRMEKLAGPNDILPPAIDGGAELRAEARDLLAYARQEVDAAGTAAADSLQNAAGIGPQPPSGWQVAGIGALLVGTLTVKIHWDTVVDLVNGTASLGNAIINNPEALLTMLGGVAMVGGGVGLMGGGGAASLTGAGAAVGAPAIGAGAAATATGAAAAAAGATALAAAAVSADKVDLLQRLGEDLGNGRDSRGRFTGSGERPWVDKEKIGLDEVEKTTGQNVIRDKVRADVEGGNPNGRYYDGLIKNEDGTYTAVEVKSGSATKNTVQREFDDLINSGSTGRATLDGKQIEIVEVILKVVP